MHCDTLKDDMSRLGGRREQSCSGCLCSCSMSWDMCWGLCLVEAREGRQCAYSAHSTAPLLMADGGYEGGGNSHLVATVGIHVAFYALWEMGEWDTVQSAE